MDPVSIPWWLLLLKGAVVSAISAGLMALSHRQKMNRAWKPIGQDGAGLVLRYGRPLRVIMPIMITLFGGGFVVFGFATWAESEEWVQWTYLIVGLFSAIVWPMACMMVWLYRMQIDERGVQVTGLFSTRTIFYNMIVEHKEKDQEVVFRLADGGKLRINKDLDGWAQAQMTIRKHAGLSPKKVEFSYARDAHD